MKYEKGDIIVSKRNQNIKLKITKCSRKEYFYYFITDSEKTIHQMRYEYTEMCCDYCTDYIREKKLKKILR